MSRFSGFDTKPLPALTGFNNFSPGQIGQLGNGNQIGGSFMPLGSGGGGGNYNVIDTLTAQQHRIANGLEANINAQGRPGGSLTGSMNSALENALTANPSGSISPENTANYINASVATPLLRQYDQSIMPRIKDSYAAVGALMGSRRGFAQQNALTDLQNTVGAELGKAQLSNQQLSANLQEQMAQRQGNTVNQQQQTALGYNQLGGELTGQAHMAIQPLGGYGGGAGISVNGNSFGGGGGGTNFSRGFSAAGYAPGATTPLTGNHINSPMIKKGSF